jgi:lysophospholipase L1-like esterase
MGWRSYPEHFAERLRWELRRVRDVAINTGISGDRMPRLLADAEWRVHRFHATVVSLMMGMNDCVAGPQGRAVFRTSLDEFRRRVSDRGAHLLLHTPNLIHYPADESRKDLAAYADILREAAAAWNVPLVDHYRHWSETRKSKYDLIYWLHDGSIHPNHFGHLALAHRLFRDLGIFDPGSVTCRLFLP